MINVRRYREKKTIGEVYKYLKSVKENNGLLYDKKDGKWFVSYFHRSGEVQNESKCLKAAIEGVLDEVGENLFD